jgi:hypothetical protein
MAQFDLVAGTAKLLRQAFLIGISLAFERPLSLSNHVDPALNVRNDLCT